MGTKGVGTVSTLEVINPEFVTVEDFGLVQPLFQGVWWGGNGEDHGGDLLI